MGTPSPTDAVASVRTVAADVLFPDAMAAHARAGVEDEMLEPAVTYMVISPTGTLVTRTVANRIRVDEWNTPYQATLWAAVHQDVDPGRGEVNGVALAHGMRAKVADAAEYEPRSYPPNPIARAVLTTLGQPPRRWAGTIAIVGGESEHGITASLTAEQRDVISRAHRLAWSVIAVG
ncbi:MAG TPA: hypothetical protein VFW65_12550 [Pseudonocardiaceae bacterium]|nr:hypothetical protein [Pseudonocardiaceae bacterium]